MNAMVSDNATSVYKRGEAIFQTILHRICTNRYPPGSTLHEERLAAEFEVSRSPIRRALAKLEQEGLVDIKHGVGTKVTQIDSDALYDVYQVRMMLAAQTGPFFVEPLTDAHLAAFAAIRDRFENLDPGDTLGFSDVNFDYYMAITDLIANKYLKRIHRSLFYLTSRIWLIRLPNVDWDEAIGFVVEEIDNISLSIAYRDAQGLGYALRNGLSISLAKLLGFDQGRMTGPS